jgi:hypothetical protein
MSAPLRGEAAAHARPPAASTTSVAFGIAAKTKQIVVKEIRAKWGKFPELMTQLVAKYSLVRLSAMSTA